MNAYHQSLVLIGMPGAGKSTLGKLVADQLNKVFIDTDRLIEQECQQSLQAILDQQGYLALRAIEEHVLLKAHYPNHVIATGGSAVYSEAAMRHLAQFGPILFLDLTLDQLVERVTNMDSRGIARPAHQTFADVYAERRPLYLRYADAVIDCNGKNPQALLEEIIYQEANAYTLKDA